MLLCTDLIYICSLVFIFNDILLVLVIKDGVPVSGVQVDGIHDDSPCVAMLSVAVALLFALTSTNARVVPTMARAWFYGNIGKRICLILRVILGYLFFCRAMIFTENGT